MNTRIMAVALVAMGLFGLRAAHAQTTLYTFNGDSVGDFFGHSVSGAGDVNGDGVPDFIVGAWRDNNNAQTPGACRCSPGPTVRSCTRSTETQVTTILADR